jgi:sodium-dependent dicarboxylate transporter 2/3/5
MLAAALLSMWISNSATALMLLPVAMAILEQTEERQQLAAPLLLGLSYGANIGGIGTPIGTPPNVIFMALYRNTTGQEWTFLQWMMIGVPVVALLLPVAWLWITRGLRLKQHLAIPYPGAWRPEERRVLTMFALAALLWIFRTEPFGGWNGQVERFWDIAATQQQAAASDAPQAIAGKSSVGTPSKEGETAIETARQEPPDKVPSAASAPQRQTLVGDSTVALLVALAMFIVPNGRGGRLLDWEAAKRLPWGLLLLFGGGLAIGMAFQASGLSKEIGGLLSGIVAWDLLAVVAVVALTVTFLTEVTSNTATTNILLPILAAASMGSGGAIPPECLMVPAAISASCAFMLPVATVPNAVVFGTDYITTSRMVREGFVLNLLGAVIITLICYFGLR